MQCRIHFQTPNSHLNNVVYGFHHSDSDHTKQNCSPVAHTQYFSNNINMFLRDTSRGEIRIWAPELFSVQMIDSGWVQRKVTLLHKPDYLHWACKTANYTSVDTTQRKWDGRKWITDNIDLCQVKEIIQMDVNHKDHCSKGRRWCVFLDFSLKSVIDHLSLGSILPVH